MSRTGASLRTVTRRSAIGGILGATGSLALGPVGLRGAAQAATSTSLRAAITGFDVINTLDPAKVTLISEYYVIWASFNALLKFDAHMKIVPDLAQSYRFVDSRTMEFKLRPGVKFQDGSDLSADDVKFSLERVLDPKTGSPHRNALAVIDAITVLDPLTVRIHTKRPYAPLKTYLTNTRTGTQIVSRKAVQALGDQKFGRSPVGTGAFRIQNWEAGQRVALSANRAYFVHGEPKVDAVEMPLIADSTSGITALLGGQVDLTSTVPGADVAKLRNASGVELLEQPGLNIRFIQLNDSKPPFDDVHFRRALSMAFNREAMLQVAGFGNGVALHSFVPPALGRYASPTPSFLTTMNAAAARAELAKSKYHQGTAATVLAWGAGFWKTSAEAFVDQVNQTLGTNLRVEVSTPNAVAQRLQVGDFQAAVWGWLGFIDPDEYVGELFTTTGSRNYGKYSNHLVDALLQRGREELNEAKRSELYQRAQEMILADMPSIPCFTSNIGNALARDVKGFVQLPYSNYGDQFAHVALA